MKLIDKDTGDVYIIVSGKVLSNPPMDIDGSFLTIRKQDNPDKDYLYMWRYWADNDFTLLEEPNEDYMLP